MGAAAAAEDTRVRILPIIRQRRSGGRGQPHHLRHRQELKIALIMMIQRNCHLQARYGLLVMQEAPFSKILRRRSTGSDSKIFL